MCKFEKCDFGITWNNQIKNGTKETENKQGVHILISNRRFESCQRV